MKNTAKIVKNIFILFAAAFALASCNIGLGEALDLKGPTVTITKPAARENVKGEFDIKGIVTDDFAVGKIVVTLGDEEWVGENGKWKHKASGSETYDDDPDSTWVASNGEKRVEWVLKGARIDSGTKTIDVSAVDKTGNTSAESHKSRDVIVDDDGPKVSIASPTLRAASTTYTDISNYKDITKVNMFITGDFTISGKTLDDNTIKYIDLIIKESDTEKYKTRIYSDEANKEDPGNNVQVDSMRSWEVPITLANIQVSDNDKHVFSIETHSEDDAGNTRNQTDLGYFCVWKEAATPWIEMNLGTNASPLSVYGNSTILGNAYDDSGISKVTVTVKNGATPVEGWNEKVVYANSDSEENNVFFEVLVPNDCATYSVTIDAWDTTSPTPLKAAQKTGYIKVEDKTFPSVEVEHYVGSKKSDVSKTLFGDSNGNFKLKITSKDDTKISKIQVAYITDPKAVINFSNAKYSGWNANSTTNKSDFKNGKILDVKPATNTTTEAATGRKVYVNEIDGINIFSDLGIDGSTKKLSNQTFVVRVEDSSGNSMTKDYTILGDIEEPIVKFTKVEVLVDGTTVSKILNAGDKIPALNSDSKLKIYGTISDDSATAWNTTSGKFAELKKGFVLKLNAGTDETLTTDVDTSGNFTAVTSSDYSGKASIVLDATLTDYAGNSNNQKLSFIVDTQAPNVEYISSKTVDGCYKAGDKIDMFMRFNKKVKFTGGTISLKLNNGATAALKTSTSSTTDITELHFEYTVKATDTGTTKLNVQSVTWDNVVIKDVNSADIAAQLKTALDSVISESSGKNLKDNKSITVITKVPVFQNATFVESTGVLTISYNGEIARGEGEVVIEQENVTNVPAVLTPKEYDSLVSAQSGIATYYEESTNGADRDFNPDKETKYVLKYTYDSNNADLVGLYKKAKAHIISQSIKSNKASISADSKQVTISFGANPLPCKGATYKITIPAGFVVDKTGGDDFPVAKTEKTAWHTSAGIEKPVIRVSTKGTVVDSSYNATQPMTAEFKVDCETPGATCKYSWDLELHNARDVYSTEQYSWGKNVANDSSSSGTSQSETKYEKQKPVTIGDNELKGLVYKITATATKGTDTEYAYQKAARTMIEVLRLKGKVDDTNTNGASNWKPSNNNVRLFIRGGDNVQASNSVSGLPLDWDTSHVDKVAMLTSTTRKVDNTDYDCFYYMTWNINVDKFYFMFMVGLCDAKTVTDSNGEGGKGPSVFCFAQNCWVGGYADYPVGAGQYMRIWNGQNKTDSITNTEFCVNEEGKPVTVSGR